MAAIAQTITVVNKSGKIVSSSKHLVNVFKEAKSAYNERKAEIKAERKEKHDLQEEERMVRRHFDALSLKDNGDAVSRSSSRRSSRKGHGEGRPKSRTTTERPPMERGVSDSFYINDRPSQRPPQPSQLRRGSSPSSRHDAPRAGELSRRHTDGMQLRQRYDGVSSRRASFDDIDMDLAYGELPPPLPERKYSDEVELRSKMTSLQRMLDEYNCVQHSATAMIENLQKNPDALAAVALTLAEISNLATKLAPGALLSMKGLFPGILALLCSPQFAIAAGVGVGVTIIAFGGYKIVKKIQARREREDGLACGSGGREALPAPETPVSGTDELRELSHVEQWRRGVVTIDGDSQESCVEGEFVTPMATRTLIEEGRLKEADLKSTVSSKSKKGKKKAKSVAGRSSSGKTSKSSAKTRVNGKKEPSGLRMLFKAYA